jgi:hypothetical protein
MCGFGAIGRPLNDGDAVVQAQVKHGGVWHTLANVGVVVDEMLHAIPEVPVAKYQYDSVVLHLFGYFQIVQIGNIDLRYFVAQRPQVGQQRLHAPHFLSARARLLARAHAGQHGKMKLRSLRWIENDAIRVDQRPTRDAFRLQLDKRDRVSLCDVHGDAIRP